MLKYFSKFIAAVLGTATPAGIIALAGQFGVEIPTELAVAIVSLLGAMATVFAPANGPHPSFVYEDQPLITPETNPELYEESTVAERAASE